MRKKILFVCESLRAAGGEKSLVTLLSLIDYGRYEVDLQLFGFGGEFEEFVPKEVNMLPPFKYTNYLLGKEKGNFKMFIARWVYSLSLLGRKKTIKEQARLYWTHVSDCIDRCHKHYDIAIAYGQCHPTFYVAEKVDADRKLAWVNCVYHLDGKERDWQKSFYDAIDKIVMVSDAALKHFQGVYPQMKDKMFLMPDLINPQMIFEMADIGNAYVDDYVGCRLLTVARLNMADKGYDITLEACRILKERRRMFRWYALGRGDYRQEMESYIAQHDLQDTFILLGTTPNPYPYIKNCDIYVQTSRHEGFGLSIAEARILNRPVVTTEFDAVWQQMVQGENGLVVPQNPVAVADAIGRLLDDKTLYNHIIEYQHQEKKGNTEEIEMFYQLIEN